jgi:hypothetical protein
VDLHARYMGSKVIIAFRLRHASPVPSQSRATPSLGSEKNVLKFYNDGKSSGRFARLELNRPLSANGERWYGHLELWFCSGGLGEPPGRNIDIPTSSSGIGASGIRRGKTDAEGRGERRISRVRRYSGSECGWNMAL